jgi:hypothetical protein
MGVGRNFQMKGGGGGTEEPKVSNLCKTVSTKYF